MAITPELVLPRSLKRAACPRTPSLLLLQERGPLKALRRGGYKTSTYQLMVGHLQPLCISTPRTALAATIHACQGFVTRASMGAKACAAFSIGTGVNAFPKRTLLNVFSNVSKAESCRHGGRQHLQIVQQPCLPLRKIPLNEACLLLKPIMDLHVNFIHAVP